MALVKSHLLHMTTGNPLSDADSSLTSQYSHLAMLASVTLSAALHARRTRSDKRLARPRKKLTFKVPTNDGRRSVRAEWMARERNSVVVFSPCEW